MIHLPRPRQGRAAANPHRYFSLDEEPARWIGATAPPIRANPFGFFLEIGFLPRKPL
jgi:hypothetical protein